MSEEGPRRVYGKAGWSDSFRPPCDAERMQAFVQEARTLLGLEHEADPAVILTLSRLPEDYRYRTLAWDRDFTAKAEKQHARKIRDHSQKLLELLERAPDRLGKHLGYWLSGLRGRGLEDSTPYEPDSHWEVRNPTVIDQVRLHLAALNQIADTYAKASSPKPARSPLERLVTGAIDLASAHGQSKATGLKIAKKAYWVVLGQEPEEGWGEFHTKKARPLKG